jgi:hypothetical protein
LVIVFTNIFCKGTTQKAAVVGEGSYCDKRVRRNNWWTELLQLATKNPS